MGKRATSAAQSLRLLCLGADSSAFLAALADALPDVQIESLTDPGALDSAFKAGAFDVVLVTAEGTGWAAAAAALRSVRARSTSRPLALVAAVPHEEQGLEALAQGLDDYVLATREDLARLPAVARKAIARAGHGRAVTDAVHRELWDSVPVGLYRTTPDGRILEANRGFIEMLGYPDREPLLATPASAVYAESADRRRWQELMERDGTVRGFETRLRRANESLIWVRESTRAVRDAAGRVTFYEGLIEDISERKSAEQALRESEARFRSLVEHASDIVIETDSARRILFASPSVERILGFPPTELLGLDGLELVHPEDVPRTAEMLADVFREPTPARAAEHRLRRKDGTWLWFETRGTTTQDASGRLRLVAISREIAGRKQAEDALRDSEERYRRLVELSPDGIVVHVQGRFVFANAAAARLLGAGGPEQIIGKPILDFVHPDYRGVVAERVRQLAQGRRDVPLIEEKFLRLDGGTLDVEVAAIPFSFRGEPAVQVVIRDISERKRAQEERTRLMLAVEQAAESIVITDTRGRIEYVNPAFERISGYSRAEALGQNPRILKSGRQEAAFYRELWSTLARGEVWSGRFINRARDGTLYEEEATITPVRDASGRVVNYVAVKRDVTHEVRLEQQFLQSQKMEAVGRLAGGVAHDFNNLLGVIIGYSELVLRGLPPGDPQRGRLEQIVRATERAATLTRQLLAFSRRQVLQPKVLDLNLVVADMDKMLRRLIGEDIELLATLQPGLGCVKADPGQIEQVIMNLAVNARDAMPEGGKLTIETRNADLDETYVHDHPVVLAGRYVMLAVSDTGSGMDLETQAHIFEPFFTTKEQGKGTGLGLSTVYGIVKQSGGYIWVYSEPGHGTTFKVYLPRVDEPLQPGERSARPLPPRGSETILLLEDDAMLREMLRETLEAHGHPVLVANDGAEALAVAQRHDGPIQLLLTDVIMPGMSGREVAERVTALRPETRVLYVSGYTDDAIVRHGVLEPGVDFLSKPFSAEALLEKLRHVLAATR